MATIEDAINILVAKDSRNADAFKEGCECRKHDLGSKEPLAEYFSFITTESAYWLRNMPASWKSTTQFRAMKQALIELSKEADVIAAVPAADLKKMVKAVNFTMSNNGLNDEVAFRSENGTQESGEEQSDADTELSEKIKKACVICCNDAKVSELIDLFWDDSASIELHDKIFEAVATEATSYEVYKLLRGIS